MPHLMNCPHSNDSRCLDCVKAEWERTQAEIDRLNQMIRDTGQGQGAIDAYVAQCEEVERLHTPRPFDDWHEDIGNVLWWSFPIEEPPYSGTPYDDEYPFEYDDPSVGWVPLPNCDKIQERWDAAEKARKT